MQEHYHEDRGRFPTWLIAIIATVIVVIVVLGLVSWYSSSSYGYGYTYGYGMMGGLGGGLCVLFAFPVGVIVLVLIVYAVTRGVDGGSCGDHYGHYSLGQERENAMETLRRRYASGEITKEQFEQMKRDNVS